MPGDGTANLRPTMAYAIFSHAEAMHSGVGVMLAGRPMPMTGMELYLWGRYRQAQRRLRQQQEGR
jgi:hypothetical protein